MIDAVPIPCPECLPEKNPVLFLRKGSVQLFSSFIRSLLFLVRICTRTNLELPFGQSCAASMAFFQKISKETTKICILDPCFFRCLYLTLKNDPVFSA